MNMRSSPFRYLYSQPMKPEKRDRSKNVRTTTPPPQIVTQKLFWYKRLILRTMKNRFFVPKNKSFTHAEDSLSKMMHRDDICSLLQIVWRISSFESILNVDFFDKLIFDRVTYFDEIRFHIIAEITESLYHSCASSSSRWYHSRSMVLCYQR